MQSKVLVKINLSSSRQVKCSVIKKMMLLLNQLLTIKLLKFKLRMSSKLIQLLHKLIQLLRKLLQLMPLKQLQLMQQLNLQKLLLPNLQLLLPRLNLKLTNKYKLWPK